MNDTSQYGLKEAKDLYDVRKNEDTVVSATRRRISQEG